jgi:hypothetical protein
MGHGPISGVFADPGARIGFQGHSLALRPHSSFRVIPLISMPTPRGQEAQLDQVVEAHRIAREGRIDYASGKEEEDQDQFSSSGRPAAVRAVAGWAVLGELAAGT